jgi:glutamate synthase domain-containing protein 2/nitrite reductase/ring-hydroxylating ferredoxin subunit
MTAWKKVATWSDLPDREPRYALVEGVDLVVLRYDDEVSVLYGRCLHRGALLSDGFVDGSNLICGVHHWDYRVDTGVSEYNNEEALFKFASRIDRGRDEVLVDSGQVRSWAEENPQPWDRDAYLGLYQDPHGTPEEPANAYIQRLAREGLSELGHHGRVEAMGVPRNELPNWDDIQIVTAQLASRPLADDDPVATRTVLGPAAARPLELDIPLFVSDMSYGALSAEAKLALAKGADSAGTGICSGEGGMLPEERDANSRYFYEYATGRFGWDLDHVKTVQAFHFKAGQGAKTGTGGHLPGHKVTERIAEVRGLEVGEAAVSPSRFEELVTSADFREMAERVREASGGIPVGIKMSAQHIEEDLDFAREVGVDYVILDGRGGGTGAAPLIFRDHISVPTLAALGRARRHLDARGADDVSLVITGGLRTETDFVKALALGADAVAVSNSAIQAIGCLGMRACHTDNCPVGIATQKDHLRSRLIVEASAQRLTNWFEATVELMQVLARACGHDALSGFESRDLTAWKREIADLTGVRYAGN